MTKPGGFSVGDVIVQKDSDLPREYQVTSLLESYYVAFAVDTGRQAWLDRDKTDETYVVVRHVDQGPKSNPKKQGRKLDL